MTQDWYAWHEQYNQPKSGFAMRLAMVQRRVRAALDEAPPGPLRAISVCAGQGTDLIGGLADHPRRHDVTARLVELDPRNAETARRHAAEAGLTGVEVVTGDASLTSQYAGMVPADLVLVCGVFGNLTDADIEATTGYCTQLCAAGGTVVWTRGRWEPDLSQQISAWFEERGFERVWLSDSAKPPFAHRVGAHRFTGTPAPLDSGAAMFTFRGHEVGKGPPRTASGPPAG